VGAQFTRPFRLCVTQQLSWVRIQIKVTKCLLQEFGDFCV
jgi:hypothetical protein